LAYPANVPYSSNSSICEARPVAREGAPATNGSRTRPAFGPSKTHRPLWEYGVITRMLFEVTIALSHTKQLTWKAH